MIDAFEGGAVALQTPAELARLATAHAYALGFDLAGIVALGPADTAEAFDSWVDSGYAGVMRTMHGRSPASFSRWATNSSGLGSRTRR